MDIAKDVLAKIEAIVKLIIDFLKGLIPEKEDAEVEEA